MPNVVLSLDDLKLLTEAKPGVGIQIAGTFHGKKAGERTSFECSLSGLPLKIRKHESGKNSFKVVKVYIRKCS